MITPKHSVDDTPTGPRTGQLDASRDPRLCVPPPEPPSRTNSKNDNTPAVQNTVQLLRQLTSEVVELDHITTARDRLIKKHRADEQMLKKAKERAHAYPALLQGLKSGQDAQVTELQRLEEKFTSHSSQKEQLLLHLANLIHAPDRIVEAQRITDDEMRLTRELVETRHASLAEQFSAVNQKIDSLVGDKTTYSDIQNLRSDLHNIRTDLSSSVSNQENVSKRIEELSSSIKTITDEKNRAHDLANSRISPLEKTVEALDKHKVPYLQAQVAKHAITHLPLSTPTAVQANITELSEQLHHLHREINDRLKVIDDHSRTSSSFINKNISDTEELKRQFATINIQAVHHSFKELRDQMTVRLNTLTAQTSAVYTAIHSLEDRYSRLTTEPIVQQVTQAIQGLYPFANRAEAEVSGLLNTAKEHEAKITAYKINIDELQARQAESKKSHDGILAHLHKERSGILESMKSLRQGTDELKENLLESLALFGADLREKAEELDGLKSRVEKLGNEKSAALPNLNVSEPLEGRSGSSSRLSTPRSDPERSKNKKRKRDTGTPNRHSLHNTKNGDD